MSYNNKVYIYRNLHKKTYSIKILGKVHGYADWISIDGSLAKEGIGCGFQVSQRMRKRVLVTGHKTVHAYVWGYDVCDREDRVKPAFYSHPNLVKVRYDPFTAPFFYEMRTLKKVLSTEFIYLTPDGIFAESPVLETASLI